MVKTMVQGMLPAEVILNDILAGHRRVLSAKQVEQFYFRTLELHSMNAMNFEMFQEFLQALKLNLPKQQRLLRVLFDHFDKDFSGFIDHKEFKMLSQYFVVRSLQTAQNLYFDDIFNILDTNSDGSITFDEIEEFLQLFQLDTDGTFFSVFEPEKIKESLQEAFGNDEITYEMWVLGAIRSQDLFELLHLDATKIQLTNQSFQILCKEYGMSKYESNALFMTIDTDHGGSLDAEELRDYAMYLDSQSVVSTHMIEITIFAVQVMFTVFIIVRMILKDGKWWEDTTYVLQIGASIGSLILFARLIFKNSIFNAKVSKILKEVLEFMRIDETKSDQVDIAITDSEPSCEDD